MDRLITLAATGAALTILAIVLLYGPVVAAFIVAGSSFVLMIGMIALSGLHAVERWRRTKTH